MEMWMLLIPMWSVAPGADIQFTQLFHTKSECEQFAQDWTHKTLGVTGPDGKIIAMINPQSYVCFKSPV